MLQLSTQNLMKYLLLVYKYKKKFMLISENAILEQYIHFSMAILSFQQNKPILYLQKMHFSDSKNNKFCIILLILCNIQNLILLNKVKDKSMISKAGKYYDRIKIVKPFNAEQRKRMYSSLQVKPQSYRRGQTRNYKDPIFDSVNRSARDSYILRHSKETIVNTNYHPRYSLVQQNRNNQQMAKAEFTRIIGDIRDQDFSLPFNQNADHRCKKSLSPFQLPYIGNKKISLNRRERSLLIKLNSNEDSINSQIKDMKSTRQSFINRSMNRSVDLYSLELNKHQSSNIQYQKVRYHDHKATKFEHYSGHQFLKEVYQRQQSPSYQILNNQYEGVIRKSMEKPKGGRKFDKYTNKKSIRCQRVDPQWSVTIDQVDAEKVINHKKKKSHCKIFDISKSLDRMPNQVFSKYPIRQSMEIITNKRAIF